MPPRHGLFVLKMWLTAILLSLSAFALLVVCGAVLPMLIISLVSPAPCRANYTTLARQAGSWPCCAMVGNVCEPRQCFVPSVTLCVLELTTRPECGQAARTNVTVLADCKFAECCVGEFFARFPLINATQTGFHTPQKNPADITFTPVSERFALVVALCMFVGLILGSAAGLLTARIRSSAGSPDVTKI